jgi:hypothetical protein
MCPFTQTCFNSINFPDELFDYRQYRIANEFGLLPQLVPVDFFNAAVLYNLISGFLWDDLKTSLRASERRLELKIVFRAYFIGPDGGALGSGEDVAEDERIGNCCHRDSGKRSFNPSLTRARNDQYYTNVASQWSCFIASLQGSRISHKCPDKVRQPD